MESAAEPATPKKRTKKKVEDPTLAEKKSEIRQVKSKRGKGKQKAAKGQDVEETIADSEKEAEEYC